MRYSYMTTGWMDVSNCITGDRKHASCATMIMGMHSARGDRGWLMHFLVFLGYLVNGMTKYDHFCMC